MHEVARLTLKRMYVPGQVPLLLFVLMPKTGQGEERRGEEGREGKEGKEPGMP